MNTFEIRHENGHYILLVDNRFYGSYDTFTEAVDDIEAIKAEKEGAA